MLFTTLGKTELRVSRMGLGCGGHSRLGQSQGATPQKAADIVRKAIDLGINFIDSAEAYGTEEAVGLGIAGVDRERVVISTKVGVRFGDELASPTRTRERVEACLGRLRTDYVDVLHFHAVSVEEYPHVLEVLVPEIERLKEEGKVRHVGITEAFIPDPGHRMLGPAVENGPWEVVMVGFSLLNPSARHRVLPFTRARGIGTLDMFAVRRALSQPAALVPIVKALVEDGNEAAAELNPADPFDFLVRSGVAESVQEAAYRFCLWETGIDVVLSGTGNIDHLRENAKSLQGPPLPDEILAKLERIFGKVDSVSGN